MAVETGKGCATARGRIAYDVAGEGPALVLLHPIGVDRSWWGEYVEAWAPSRRVIAIDMPGHGESELLTAPITLQEHATCVWQVLDAAGVRAASFMGVSMGGMVAQYAAIQRPRAVSALVACATAAAFPDEVRAAIRARGDMNQRRDMATIVPDTLRRWFGPGAPAPLLARCEARLLAGDWTSWSANWAAIAGLDTVAGLQAIEVPTLAVSCAADASMPAAVTRRIAEAARGEFVSVDGASHFGAFEAPPEFIALAADFIGRHEGARRPS